MTTPEIINYIKQQLTSGAPREQISNSLKQNGWTDTDIAEAFNAVSNPPSATPPASPLASPQVSPIAPIVSPASIQTVSVAPSHMLRNSIFVIIVLALLSGGGWYYYQNFINKNTPVVENEITSPAPTPEAPVAPDFDSFKVTYTKVPDEENSLSIFNTVSKITIAPSDGDFLNKYFGSTVSIDIKSIPLVESKKILDKYKNILKVFEMGTDKKYYQCSLTPETTCPLNTIRNSAKLAELKSIVLYKDGKIDESKAYAQRIIKLGQMLGESNNNFITFLVNIAVQKIGYSVLTEIKPITKLSEEEKTTLINNLREVHKNALKSEANWALELVDYIDDQTPLGKDGKDRLKTYRDAKNSTNWDFNETRKLFHDSFQTAIDDVDIMCGSEIKNSVIDVGLENSDNPLAMLTKNYLGKTLYRYLYVSLETANTKRCEVETLINGL